MIAARKTETNKHEITTSRKAQTQKTMADVLKQLSFTKELTDVLKVAFPGLAEIAQKTEYEITISNDKKGLRISCYVGAPIDLESDQPAQPIEIETIEIPVGELKEGVSIERLASKKPCTQQVDTTKKRLQSSEYRSALCTVK